MKIGIVGYGTVGKAVHCAFDTGKTNVYTVDPTTSTTIDSMYAYFTPDIIFVCVPTPSTEDGIDSNIIEGVMHAIAKHDANPIVIIKSTITPDVVKKLEKIYNRIVYNPEFLTERNAINDFVNADFLILGSRQYDDAAVVERLYENYSECKPCKVFHVDLEAAAMIKYTLNTFMAMKVIFFNQMYDIYKKSGTTLPWNCFTEILSTDSRMGKTHMMVPGFDNKRGFGGTCFPKDSTALIKYASNIEQPFTLLEEAIRINNLYTT